jgi:hypothetical protein
MQVGALNLESITVWHWALVHKVKRLGNLVSSLSRVPKGKAEQHYLGATVETPLLHCKTQVR